MQSKHILAISTRKGIDVVSKVKQTEQWAIQVQSNERNNGI